jgi:flagellar hook protein FlgE
MLRSLYTGISSLMGNQKKLEVVGHNIANAGTAGFKRSRLNFEENFSQTLQHAAGATATSKGHNPLQIGLGSRVASIDRIMEQGSLELTGNMTDLAVFGDAFFMVQSNTQNAYTRNGAFQINPLGALVTADGQAVLGLNANSNGELPGISNLAGIQLNLEQTLAAQASTQVQLQGNLDASMTESVATLMQASNSAGVSSVSGTSGNGLGGEYTVTVTGEAATQSLFTGSNGAVPGALTESMTLGELGVTLFEGFEISLDGNEASVVDGFSSETTLGEFLNLMESRSPGLSAEISEGEILIKRTHFGSGENYNIALSEEAGVSDVLSRLLGSSESLVNNGVDSTLAATAEFASSEGSFTESLNLTLGDVDATTGQVTAITGLGGGGVQVHAANGLQAGSFSVETANTTHETTIRVYDSLGESHQLTLSFTRSPEDNVWTWEAALPAPTTMLAGSSGTVRFNESDGSLASFEFTGSATSLSFDPGNGSVTDIRLDAGDVGTLMGLTQSTAPTTALAHDQDGRPMGELTSIDFLDDGRIQGVFSNGESQTLAQVVLARFNNSAGLSAAGGSDFAATSASGVAKMELPGEGGKSMIKSGYLEMSNTDLTKEFTELILAQRSFQASAKVISTSDQMLEEAMRLKR